MANFNSNKWYQIGNGCYEDDLHFAGSVLLGETNLQLGAAFMQMTDVDAPEQRWQVYTFNETYYVLRGDAAGPGAYLSARVIKDPPNDSPNVGNTQAEMAVHNITDDGMFWSIEPWGDGSFKMWNGANGTDWNLALNDTSAFTYMDSNINPDNEHPCQEFSFRAVADIDDDAYSKVQAPPSEPTSTPDPPSPSGDPQGNGGARNNTGNGNGSNNGNGNNNNNSSGDSGGGLSTGASVGIGVGVGIAVLVAAILAVLLLLRRRRRQRNAASAATENKSELPAPLPAGPAKYGGYEPVKQREEQAPVELAGHYEPGGRGPAELDAVTPTTAGGGPGPGETPAGEYYKDRGR